MKKRLKCFLRAARHAELDIMTGVSSNIMCGQEGYYGTGSFQVLLNIDEMNKLGDKLLEEQLDISKLLQTDDPNDICSKQNIVISDTPLNISRGQIQVIFQRNMTPDFR